jgi:putative ABC transport system ATP-binding protein
LNILGLLDNPTKGDFFFLDENVANYNERQRARLRKRNIGFVFQNFNLIDQLSVFENVELPLIYLRLSARDRKEKVEAALEKMQISHRKKHYPNQLSGGQQQRVAVARAVVSEPHFILADEPTGNLDSTHGDEVMNLLAGLNENGTTIIMVTHSQRDAEYSHRIVHLFDGQVLTENIKRS